MAEIIDFNDCRGKIKADDKVMAEERLATQVWCCGFCGNTTFQLILSGECRCSHCNNIASARRHFDPTKKP